MITSETTKSPQIRTLTLNKPQIRASLAKWLILVLIWSRGTGKSTFIAWIIHLIVRFMPRSCSTVIGRTYHQIMTRTMPSTIASLERLGYYKDVHYFIGKRPPKTWNWPEPYEPPLSYDYVMIWYNGTAFEFVSQDREGMGRGPNRDFII